MKTCTVCPLHPAAAPLVPAPLVAPLVPTRQQKLRIEREMAEFDEYSDYFHNIERISDTTVRFTLAADGSVWEITRDYNYLIPPRATKDGKLQPNYGDDYSPAISAARWALMLAFVTPI